MDFLDPHKQRVRKVELITGYVLVGILILLATIVLLYQAYGFGLGKHGQVIQNGLVFISSTPSPATIYFDGINKGTTNSRLIVPSGQYIMQLKKTGYRVWSRAFNVDGGSVEHFDYPFLVPITLVTKNTNIYSASPSLVLQSPSRRWLLVQQPASMTTFDEFDLSNPPKIPMTTVTIPTGILTSVASGSQSLTLVSWSTDNQHVILAHNMPTGTEYIVLDTQTPSDSFNLSTKLGLGTTSVGIGFINNVYNQYYLYNNATQTLSTASLQAPAAKVILSDVLAYKTYGSNIIVYASSKNVPAGEVAIRILDGNNSYDIRDVPSGTNYLLNLAQYSGDWYLAIGVTSENEVYVYQNAEQDLQSFPNQPVAPIDILRLPQPDYIDFSADDRMLVAENGSQFAVYDALNNKDYRYNLSIPLDPPQMHATWMNGEQLSLISSGKVVVFDFDDANQQTLSDANPTIGDFFDTPYKYIYTVSANTDPTTSKIDPFALTNTALRIPADL